MTKKLLNPILEIDYICATEKDGPTEGMNDLDPSAFEISSVV